MFTNVTEIKRANRENGFHFFAPDTLRYFHSRTAPGVYGGRLFVTSEQFDDDTPRAYTVRYAHDDGSIDDASPFQQFDTLDQARRHAKALAVVLETAAGWLDNLTNAIARKGGTS
jgi:hypothetical protein